jgi:hypothetical protein
MDSKTKFVLGVLTALAMFGLTFLVPRGSALRDAQLVQFPVTVGVWAIFREGENLALPIRAGSLRQTDFAHQFGKPRIRTQRVELEVSVQTN